MNHSDQAAKSAIIDGRIQGRYEQLTDGRPMEDNRLKRVRELPLDYLQRLADELDRAAPDPNSPYRFPSRIVLSALCDYAEDQRAKQDAGGISQL